MSTEQRVAIVTGAARGIGKGIAERLGRDGLHVIVADLEGAQAGVEETVTAFEHAGAERREPSSTSRTKHPSTRSSPSPPRRREAGCVHRQRGHRAGRVAARLLKCRLPAGARRERHRRLLPVPLGSEAVHQAGRGGKIIGAASIVVFRPFALLGPYSASKWAVRGLTQAAAMEWAEHKITVNAYGPGIVGTAMWDLIDEKLGAKQGLAKGEALAENAKSILLGRVSVPNDVAQLVSYLSSEDSDYVTGQTILVDGGIQFS